MTEQTKRPPGSLDSEIATTPGEYMLKLRSIQDAGHRVTMVNFVSNQWVITYTVGGPANENEIH